MSMEQAIKTVEQARKTIEMYQKLVAAQDEKISNLEVLVALYKKKFD